MCIFFLIKYVIEQKKMKIIQSSSSRTIIISNTKIEFISHLCVCILQKCTDIPDVAFWERLSNLAVIFLWQNIYSHLAYFVVWPHGSGIQFSNKREYVSCCPGSVSIVLVPLNLCLRKKVSCTFCS